ncbi:hypothetical protein KAR91_28975 [Candidatus Pacearchaeota archaeon]|nr:hypothetical protein [Candidatus Pacearchaeota archaeon]
MKTSQNDISKFAIFMRAFEINCSVPKITKDQLNLYFTALKQFSMAEVVKAFTKVLNEWEYTKMPPVAVFIKAISNQPLLEDLAQIQATEVLKQVRILGAYGTPEFKDPITKHLIKIRFHFKGLCLNMRESEEKWFIKDFVEAYQSFSRNTENLLIETPEELKQITNNLFESVESATRIPKN